MANCAYHPERDSVGACVSCGKLVCAECKTVLGGKIYCNPCADKEFSGVTENTSGQGKAAVVPDEIKGWNWGGFLLCWIWGIGNKVWIALLALLPFVGFIMNIVLGIKGNEWAWRNKKWDSVAHFKTTQRIWAIVGLVVLVPYFIFTFGVLAAVVIPNVGRFIGQGEMEAMEAAETEFANVRSAVHALMVDNELAWLPNPVTSATNDMSAFPDTTAAASKGTDVYGNAYTANDKAGFILYQHDRIADGGRAELVNYVTSQYSNGTYTVDRDGTVTQVTTGYE